MAFIRFAIVFSVLPATTVGSAFPPEEYVARLHRAQSMMKQNGMDALLLTMEAHHYYFTGMQSEFWASPTRPYYLVIPAVGKITAVVPSIIEPLYKECDHTVDRVLSWNSPQPDDDGISLLVSVLKSLQPSKVGSRAVIGAELGPEFQLRVPVSDFLRVKELSKNAAKILDASDLLKRLRAVKSEAEIATQQQICKSQSEALNNIPKIVHAGITEKEACRKAKIELMRAGADRVLFAACRSGPGGYIEIVGAATDRKLAEGDVLFIDTGAVLDGYFCDFNRNWYVGWEVPPELQAVHEAVYDAIEAGIQAAHPGRGTADIFQAMAEKLPGSGSNVGRSGHGSGLVITEWPSIMSASAGENVTLEEGMVFSVEPALGYGDMGQFLVQEEVIVIRKGGAKLLSERGPVAMPLITAGLASGADRDTQIRSV